MDWKPDKSKYKDEKGRYIVQGLFLEDRYNADMAVFTFDGEDKVYNGKLFPSLRRLYIEHGDPKEYSFARKYLYDWDHWQRICKNKVCSEMVNKAREELELSLVCEGIATLIDLAVNDKSYQAAKWLADKGWDKNERGRPSAEQIEGELKKRADQAQEWDEGFDLLQFHRKNK